MTHKNIRTDLAMEVTELIREQKPQNESPASSPPEGIVVQEDIFENIKVTRVKIVSPVGEKRVGKPIGNYITLEIPALREYNPDIMETAAQKLAGELEPLLGDISDKATILVVGLGNSNITADALGPRVVSKMMVTRHLTEYVPDQVGDDVRPVCAIAPGVLGTTGIETSEIVKGIVEKIRPSLVIAIDSLASRKTDRVSTTIQLADTGISPGSGVGNRRAELSLAALGIPVIAIGVPTVIDAATMTSDAIDLVINKLADANSDQQGLLASLKPFSEQERSEVIEKLLHPYMGNLVVTPKEIDDIIDRVANVIANALNMSLQKGIQSSDMNKFIH